jgi:hypothetical protein
MADADGSSLPHAVAIRPRRTNAENADLLLATLELPGVLLTASTRPAMERT